jgi:hypothetical protein
MSMAVLSGVLSSCISNVITHCTILNSRATHIGSGLLGGSEVEQLHCTRLRVGVCLPKHSSLLGVHKEAPHS